MPRATELTEFLNQYFRNSRRKPGETINSYVTRKTEIYMRARQALRRLKPHQEAQGTTARNATSTTHLAYGSRRSSWTSEAEGQTAEAATAEEEHGEETEPEDPWRSWRSSWGGQPPYWTSWQWQGNAWSWTSGAPWNTDDGASWTTGSSWGGSQPRSTDGANDADQLLPDWVQGWYLLQDAGLTAGERNMIYTALKGEFSMNRVAQELRNQWPEHEIKRHDQQHRASGFLGQVDDISDDEADTNVSFNDEELNEEGQALMAETEDQAAEALAVIQRAKKTLKEARARQHNVRISRKYYRGGPPSGGGASSSGSRDDSHITCLRCGRTGHRAANCDQPPTFQKKEDAPFVCFAQAETATPDPQAWATGLSTSDAVAQGMGVLDGGATKTLGSVQAIEHLMAKNQAKHGSDGVAGVDLENRPVFGFADSGEAQCLSTVQLQISAAGQPGRLQIHALDKGGGPILISIATLRSLKAILDFENDLLVLRALSTKRVIPLQRSATGHQLIDLTSDLFKESHEAVTDIPDLKHYIDRSG